MNVLYSVKIDIYNIKRIMFNGKSTQLVRMEQVLHKYPRLAIEEQQPC